MKNYESRKAGKKKKKRQVRNGETAKLLFVFKYFLKLLSTEMKATISNK